MDREEGRVGADGRATPEQTCGCSCTANFSPQRRLVLGGLVAAGVASICGASRALADDEDGAPTLRVGDRFALDEGDKKPLKPGDLGPGTALMAVYPVDPATGTLRTDSRFNMLNLVRVDGAPAGAASGGVIAFSAICTHKGCSITSFEATQTRWRCFCHLSEFDAKGSGEVLDGPAEVSLPTVKLALDAEGYLIAESLFSAEPGAAA